LTLTRPAPHGRYSTPLKSARPTPFGSRCPAGAAHSFFLPPTPLHEAPSMNHRRPVRISRVTLGLLAALAAAPAFAQSTSAGLSGDVVDASGQPVAGAEVVTTHVESGTVSRSTTDASGRYNARGLRVGGPYSVTITKAGE